MLSKKKKIFIIVSMLVLLGVSGYLNVVLNNKAAITSEQVNAITVSIFDSYRTDRQSTRTSEIAYYDAIINSTQTSSESRQIAESKRQSLVEMMDKELVAEGLIKAKGFEDAFITTSDSLISCVVKAESVSSSEVAQIYSILSEQLNAKIDNVQIIPID